MSKVRLLKASAGSGKTYQLAYQFVRTVIDNPTLYRHILAVTFTNKATEEMKRRILLELNDLATGEKSNYMHQLTIDLALSGDEIKSRAKLARTKILHDYSRFAVLTIDKFFQRIIRSFIKELGIDLNFNLELQTDSLLSSAADNLIDDIALNDDLRRWVTEFVEEKIEENKRWDVKGDLINLGKEIFSEEYKRYHHRMLAKEQLSKIVDKATARYFAVVGKLRTDASKALEIIHSNGLFISDFPYKGSGFANYFNKINTGKIEDYGVRVQSALDSDTAWYSATSAKKDEIIVLIPTLRPLLESICEGVRTNLIFLNSTELLRENYRNFALLSDLSKKVEEICITENIMPISETNMILHKLVADNDTPFIFEKVGNHFYNFMIDEFQDTSTTQWENFKPLLHNALSQSKESPILLVGDIKQSIYRWRGGDWRILAQEVEQEFREVESTSLVTNYRSLENIVKFNNGLIEQCVTADNETLNASLNDAINSNLISTQTQKSLHDMLKIAYEDHKQESAKKSDSGDKGRVSITYYEDRESKMMEQELHPVIDKIEQLQDQGYALGDIAILVRYNKDGVKIADMLLEHKRMNPNSKYCYDVVTQEALMINSSGVVGFITACMKLTINNRDAFSRVIYNKFLNHPVDAIINDSELEFLAFLNFATSEEAFEKIVIRYELSGSSDNISYLQAFHEQIMAYSSSAISDIALFVKWWEENGGKKSIQIPQSQSAITIISIHKAKGLQYKAVVIPYCDWSLVTRTNSIIWAETKSDQIEGLGVMPIKYKNKMGQSVFADSYFNELVLSHIDNINTFYVAVTRAMEELHIMIPQRNATSSNRVSSLITKAISENKVGVQIQIGDILGVDTETEFIRTIEFGETKLVEGEKDNSQKPAVVYSQFNTYDISERLKLRFNSQRYLEEKSTTYSISPRSYGVLMHSVFENIESREDVDSTIEKMVLNGEISSLESEQLRALLKESFENELVNSWFDTTWEVVRIEEEIITPDGDNYRPDRVLTTGDQAVVIDYKFGMSRRNVYNRQISKYIELLSAMGYKKVSGYIWYVSLKDVEYISIPTALS